MRSYPQFSFWIQIALAKIYFSRIAIPAPSSGLVFICRDRYNLCGPTRKSRSAIPGVANDMETRTAKRKFVSDFSQTAFLRLTSRVNLYRVCSYSRAYRKTSINSPSPSNKPPVWKSVFVKVGTHEGTSRRDLFQGLVRCRVYTMGQVAGTSPLKGLHAGTCYTSKQQNLGRFH